MCGRKAVVSSAKTYWMDLILKASDESGFQNELENQRNFNAIVFDIKEIE